MNKYAINAKKKTQKEAAFIKKYVDILGEVCPHTLKNMSTSSANESCFPPVFCKNTSLKKFVFAYQTALSNKQSAHYEN